MPTNIAVIRNDSDRSITGFNSENIGNSFLLNPLTQSPPSGMSVWISYHQDRPLVVFTKKGVCRLWDVDWKLHGIWEGTTKEVVFLSGQGSGLGANVRMNVSVAGDLAFVKL